MSPPLVDSPQLSQLFSQTTFAAIAGVWEAWTLTAGRPLGSTGVTSLSSS
jgi:hypothetical protein